MYEYRAKVLRVIDGDTFEALVDLGFNIHHWIRVRVKGIDTPEVRTRDANEKIAGKAVAAYLRDMVEDQAVILTSYEEDSFGRWLCDVSFKGDNIVPLLENFLSELS